jgi:hypothetical protein
VSDSRDDDQTLLIVDRVDHAVVADSDAKVVAAGELDCTPRSRMVGEAVDRSTDPVSERPVQAAKAAGSLGMEPDLVLARYSRTSAQETEADRSSRARRAARLSSRYSSRSSSSA